jgi:hypothetical protein
MATALRSFSDEFYDGQLERTLAAAYADAADLGEAFAVARRIHRPTPDRWHKAWSERARAVGQRVWEAVVYDWISRVISKRATPEPSLP